MESKILSPYTFLFEDKGDKYVFNSESLFFSRISDDAYDLLNQQRFDLLDQKTYNTLLAKKVLIGTQYVDTFYNHMMTRYLTSAYSDDTMTLVIAPTTACNFACPYCFEPKLNPQFITQEVEDRLISYVNNQRPITKIALTWYGGEPLLAYKSIERIYHRIIEETDKTIVRQEIISNAYLINDDVIDMMQNCKISKIQISIDGIKERHDKTRFLKATKGPTFNIIEENIEKLSKALPQLQISLRVNIDKNNWQDFVEIYKKYRGADWHRNIYVYPGFLREDSEDGCALKHNCFTQSELVDLHFKFAENGVNVNMFPSPHCKGCMLQRANAFIVGPEGELYKCWNDVSNPGKVIGSIMNDDLIHYDILMKYMQECKPIREECKMCHVFPICDGGCGHLQYRNKFENGNFELCSPLNGLSNLKRALLYSIMCNQNSDGKILNL